jgi:hypothetical protein
MPAPQNIIAVVFDFDDTLTDDSTTKLLAANGIDPVDFWQHRMKKTHGRRMGLAARLS